MFLSKERQQKYIARLSVKDNVGREGFWPSTIRTPKTVAVPKPDSHLLGITARTYAKGSALDLFSGSGVVAAWLLGRVSDIHCCDINSKSIKFIQEKFASITTDVTTEVADVFPMEKATYDIITANPPYSDAPVSNNSDIVCFDPNHESVRKLILGLSYFLKDDGVAFISWSSFAEFSFLESLLVHSRLKWSVASSFFEPESEFSHNFIEYRVFKVQVN